MIQMDEEMKEQIMESARFLGLLLLVNLLTLFDNLEKTLTKLEESLDT